MNGVQNGNTVKVHYTGRLNDGEVFDSSFGKEPLEFTVGEDQVIAGFEEAVLGMQPGDEKTIDISSDQAYGPHNPDLVLVVDRDSIPPHIDPQIGTRLRIQGQGGGTAVVAIIAASQESVTLDGNHPLAGKDLTFDIQLLEID